MTAWALATGASLDDLRRGEWVFIERPHMDAVVVAVVDGFGLVAAPPTVLDIVRGAPRRSLLDPDQLVPLLPAGGHAIGTADLLFAEHIPDPSPIATEVASPTDVSEMRKQVSSSEWEESGIGETGRVWKAPAMTGSPAAIAGFDTWHSELAQMAIIADARYRGSGVAYAAAAVATGEAVREGLIAQWRSRQGNAPSTRLAHRLGYVRLGGQAAVALTDR